MNPTDIIETLWKYGHFHNTKYAHGLLIPSSPLFPLPDTLKKLTVTDEPVRQAIRSYQDFFKPTLDELTIQTLNHPGTINGEIDPATINLLQMERCGLPDFQLMTANGTGSWPAGCHPAWPNNHTFTVQMNKSGMPSFLNNIIEPAWELCRAAYANIGIVFIREDNNPNANTNVTWTRGSGWIGLAIVGNNQRCGTRIWAKFDTQYKPSDLINQWARLLAHEFGHNMGMGHSRGGIMNPSIVNGPFLPTAWRGDPSESTLTRWFGGVPINLGPTPPQPPQPPQPPTPPKPPAPPKPQPRSLWQRIRDLFRGR